MRNLNAKTPRAPRRKSTGFLFHRIASLALILALLASWRFDAGAQTAPRALPPSVENQLRALLRHPEMREGHVGVAIRALGRAGKSVFPSKPYARRERPWLFVADADKKFMPASNMKLFTAALALQQLGPDKTFQTRVLCDRQGEEAGEVWLVGGGDPSLDTVDVQDLAKQVASSGLKKVQRFLVGDGSLFRAETFGGRYPDGWTMDDALWYYGPEVSALAFHRNQLDVTVRGAPTSGQPATVTLERIFGDVAPMSFALGVETKATPRPLVFEPLGYQGLLGSGIVVRGQVAPKQEVTEGIAVPDPERFAARALSVALRAYGIETFDQATTIRAIEAGPPSIPVSVSQPFRLLPPRSEIARHTSPPVSFLLRRFLKSSDNLYGEMLLRDAALAPGQPDSGTAARAHRLLAAWLKSRGVATQNLRFEDGSGLSRYNMLTPRAIVSLLSEVETLRGGNAFWDALPIAGRDGTLKSRMAKTAAQDNARAKTGTFSIASCLSGYVTTRDGHRLAVSIMTNFVTDGQIPRRVQDRVFAILGGARLG